MYGDLNTKVVLKQTVLRGSNEPMVLQPVATVYIDGKEYRVSAPPDATGDALEWVPHFTVRCDDDSGFGGEVDAAVDPRGVLALKYVEDELKSQKREANKMPAIAVRNYGKWELAEPPLGEGGQSKVYRARKPERVAERQQYLEMLKQLSGQGFNDDRAAAFAGASWGYARPEEPSEFGALKIFKIREGGAPAAERLRVEVAILRQNKPNLPQLLEANETEQWMVTEYFPGGTLGKHPSRYKGDPIRALRAFRTLVETVATSLHKDKIVHRDIKPDNVFIGNDGSLIPGDFGIAYLPNQTARVTITDERVGPWEYMPQWGDWGVRLEKVEPNFDVYMLGKLLWCMVAGRLRLPREYHRQPEFDLTFAFANNKYMSLINSILDKCLVERPELCLPSAYELLVLVDKTLAMIDQGVPMLDDSGRPIMPCRVCGKGFYQDHTGTGIVQLPFLDEYNRPVPPMRVRVFVCNVCTNYAFFAPGHPEEAAKKGWTPWSPLKSK
jgi:serine/threonine protein kinase